MEGLVCLFSLSSANALVFCHLYVKSYQIARGRYYGEALDLFALGQPDNNKIVTSGADLQKDNLMCALETWLAEQSVAPQKGEVLVESI